jgi:serine/threonine protein kinase
MAAVSPATSRDFLALCRKSGLVEARQLEEFLARTRLPEDANGAAHALVEAGLLTKYHVRNLLAGKYRGMRVGQLKVLTPIGKGGMGAVFLCEHTGLRKQVAVKFLPENKATDPGLLKRFLREARSVAALNHPNIIRTNDFGITGNVHYLVMEYIEGTDLEKLVRAEGPLPHAQATEFIRQAAAGLQHAYEKGLVHRDMKPANLLVDKKGVVRILDFGLARSFTDDTDRVTEKHDKGAVIGTADYMAPEQVLGGTVDVRADIYALGVTFYTLLTGRPPFSGSTSQKFTAHQTFEAPPVSRLRPSVPAGVEAVVEKMMAKSPAARYQTPQEVIDALATAGTDAAPANVAIRRQSTGPAAQPPPVPRKLWVGGSIAIGVAAGLIAWALMPGSRAATVSPPPDPTVTQTGSPAEPATTPDSRQRLPSGQ